MLVIALNVVLVVVLNVNEKDTRCDAKNLSLFPSKELQFLRQTKADNS